MKKRENNYIDFHTHTTASDGFLLPAELVNEAYHAGIHMLAITDHNTCTDVTALKSTFPEMELIQGCEFSCHAVINGKKMELHIVGLDFDPKHPAIQKILHQNSGAFGHRLAYVDSGINCGIDYGSMEEVIDAIHTADDGVAVLAHLFYYQSDDNDELVRRFKLAGGDAIEVCYPTYTEDQKAEVQKLAEKYELLASGGSDYHHGYYANLHYLCPELLNRIKRSQNLRLIDCELFRKRNSTVSWWNFSKSSEKYENIAELFQVYNPNETGGHSDA